MDIYRIFTPEELLKDNTYPGRGIVIGNNVAYYWIMGRSENSRNRIFALTEDGIETRAFDESKVADPSLIIYHPVRKTADGLIVTNGDQTDTIYEGLAEGKSFKTSLETRSFEPDSPNFTPRISGILTFSKKDFSYEMSILKSADAEGTACNRYTFSYTALPGLGHFIHTYVGDGSPLPTFQGEPERVKIGNDIDAFTNSLWDALNHDNRISLFVRYTDLATGKEEKRLINRNA